MKDAIRILLIEDSRVYAEAIAEALRLYRKPVEVVLSGTLSDARRKLAERLPDLVVTDYLLPDGTGLELLSGSLEESQFPVLLMTGEGNEEIAVEALKAGALDYVVKSAASLKEMPRILDRVLREWGHIVDRRRAREALEYRGRFEELITSISTKFINLEPEEVDPEINRALGRIGEFAGVDRSYVFRFRRDGSRMDNTHEWCAGGIDSQRESFQDLPVERFSWHLSRLRKEGAVYCPSVASLGPEAEAEKREWERAGTMSLILVPMIVKGEMVGFVGFDSVREEKMWPEDTPLLLRIVGESFANALERKRAEEALRESENRFRSVFRAAAAGMSIISPDGRFLQVNPALCEFLGCSEEDLLKRSVEEITHPEDRSETITNYCQLFEGRCQALHYEKRYLRKDGKVPWGHASVACVQDLTGEPAYCVALVQDITDRKKAEEELEAAKRRLQDIVEFLPDATFVIDKEHKVVAWNRAMEEMTGVPKDRIIGEGDYAYALPFYDRRRPVLIDLIGSPDLKKEADYEILGKKGESLFVEAYLPKAYGGRGAHAWATATRLFDEEGNYAGAIESIRDITERKRGEEKLKEANRELDAFVYTVSHDLRTPLTPIIGYAEFLKESCAEVLDAQSLEILDEIETQGDRMLTLLEDLLELSKVGHLGKTAEAVDTEAVLKEVISGMESRFEETGLSLTKGDLPQVKVQETLLSQVFTNLFGNALRYAGRDGGPIEVDGEVRGPLVRFYVRDHGPGIPEKESERIFDVFYRGSTAKEVKGTGIGLAIVQKIARTYGGSAWVEETPGGGSTFIIELPAADGEE